MSGNSLDFISRQLRGFEQGCNTGGLSRLDLGRGHLEGGAWFV